MRIRCINEKKEIEEFDTIKQLVEYLNNNVEGKRFEQVFESDKEDTILNFCSGAMNDMTDVEYEGVLKK